MACCKEAPIQPPTIPVFRTPHQVVERACQVEDKEHEPPMVKPPCMR